MTWAATSLTVQPSHSDWLSHCSAHSPASVAARARRSAWMCPRSSPCPWPCSVIVREPDYIVSPTDHCCQGRCPCSCPPRSSCSSSTAMRRRGSSTTWPTHGFDDVTLAQGRIAARIDEDGMPAHQPGGGGAGDQADRGFPGRPARAGRLRRAGGRPDRRPGAADPHRAAGQGGPGLRSRDGAADRGRAGPPTSGRVGCASCGGRWSRCARSPTPTCDSGSRRPVLQVSADSLRRFLTDGRNGLFRRGDQPMTRSRSSSASFQVRASTVGTSSASSTSARRAAASGERHRAAAATGSRPGRRCGSWPGRTRAPAGAPR